MIEGRAVTDEGRILRYGMVGGGPDAFIGGVHRAAIAMNGTGTLVAGCFSRHQDKNEKSGRQLRLEPDRVYADFEEMAEKEAAREDKIDFVVICVPNTYHYAVAKAFLIRGFDIVCEKPLVTSLQDGLELQRLAKEHDCLFCVFFSYTGHLMAKEARALIRRGEIGEIMVVQGEFPQDWLVDLLEKEQGQKQASWRTDPAQTGITNCTGDLGSHVENMVSFMTGLRIKSLCAKLDIFGEGRILDTNSTVLIKYTNGASGCYWTSQVAIGNDNGLRVRIYGTKGSIEFEQDKCNYLKVTMKYGAPQTYARGGGYIVPEAAAFTRIPTGHPEGHFEAFANIYSSFTNALWKKLDGEKVIETEAGYPTIDMGIDGIRFLEKCVESSQKGSIWVDVE
jgi:predicted dehydrogenase